eukprot:CAMPEP_0114654522 /NCGR_PEP_ID=MMETSP0191-20121206/10533_1 /TAXON_ID=126664 /ORGANISM="Sorites sp." /LENGTH=253 /DNA_ID=CAMNT_0001870031 /DNA_START=49 /DNA_END=807 /DNA_ORIENTATION=-
MQNQQMHDITPKVAAFRSFCQQVVDQVCIEFEREVSQMSKDIILYRGELARCADLLAFQLGKEKEYHNMLENIAGNSSMLVGKAQEVGQKHGAHDAAKQQMHQMLEDMFAGGKGALAENFGGLDEHRQLAEKHLMSSAELQNQSQAVAKELDNIMRTLNEAPVSYREAPVMMGPSQMQGPPQPQRFGNGPPPMYGGPNGPMAGPNGGAPPRFNLPGTMSPGSSPSYSPPGRGGGGAMAMSPGGGNGGNGGNGG